ncbi:hypothetical protein Tco_1326519, partial [Tanacetum coccineum]
KGIEDNLFKEVFEYMKIFDELDKEYDQCVIYKKSLETENKNLLIQNECLLAESVSKDICSVVLTSVIAEPINDEYRSNCIKEHSINLELEAEILKVCNNSSSPELNVFFEINKLKDQLQGKDELLGKLKAQISNMKEVSADSNLSTLEFQALETKNTQLKEELTAVRIKNDSLSDENVSIKKRYQDLYQSKAESNSNVSSRAIVPEKPKVLAPGLYAMTPKYIPPQKRNNREANTPLPKEREVAFAKPHHMIAPGSSRQFRWVPTGRIFTSSTTKVDSEPTNGSDADITNQYEYKQTLDVSAGTPNLSAGLGPNSMAPGHNGAGPEINNL